MDRTLVVSTGHAAGRGFCHGITAHVEKNERPLVLGGLALEIAYKSTNRGLTCLICGRAI
jgi:hypothetical protein